MEWSENFSIALVVSCMVFLPFTLQTIGLFSPYWVSNSSCDSIGLLYSCCSGSNNDTCKNTNGGDELDVRVLGLESTSFVVMLLAVTGSVYCIRNIMSDDEEDNGIAWFGFICSCSVVLAVAELLNFIGCMLIVGNYSIEELRWSFYLCLVSACFTLLVDVIGWIWCCIGLIKDS